MPKYVNKVGEIHNGLQLVEELGKGKILAKCMVCGSIEEFDKYHFLHHRYRCKNKECCNSEAKPRTNIVGFVAHDLMVTEELGKNQVKAKCLLCGFEGTYLKYTLKTNQCACKNTNCANSAQKIKESKRTNTVGFTINKLVVLEDLAGRKVRVKCTICGTEAIHSKSAMKIGKCKCKNKSCSNSAGKAKIKDLTGQVFAGIKIVEEFGGNRVLGECIYCGSTREYFKTNVIQLSIQSCGCVKIAKYVDRTGEEFKGIKIIKELGNDKIIGECTYCKSQKQYKKGAVVRGNYASCGCLRLKNKISDGQIFRDTQIIKQLSNTKVLVKCLKCGYEYEANTYDIVDNRKVCIKCTSPKRDRTGEIHNNLEIIHRNDKVVKTKCQICGEIADYDAERVFNNRVGCKKCSLNKNYKDKVINNVTVIKLGYTGRNGQKYYKCKCNSCNKELFLTRKEIVEYKCNKE